jgi:hypothetical protein
VGVFILLSGLHSETRQGHTKEQIGKKSAHSHINSTGMSTHDNNIGSRKVEPEMQAQQLWRLRANYLMRQLARIWYGKLPVRDYPNSPEFECLFLGIMCQFVEDYGGDGGEVLHRVKWGRESFEFVHGREITFKDRVCELDWMIRKGIPKELHERFMRDEVIQDIIRTVEWILAYEGEGKEPPYERPVWLESLDYYEALPVLGPEPEWKLIANGLLLDLAHVWYGKTTGLPKDFQERLGHLLVAFAIDNGVARVEFMEKAEAARNDFEALHGCELSFRNIVQGIIWTAEEVLPPHLATQFLHDPQIKFILTATELIYALSRAGIQPPYEKYMVSFSPLEKYEKLPVRREGRSF